MSVQNLKKFDHAIIIRTYNRPSYLNNCLESLASQTYKNFNCYIIDDSEGENNIKIINKYKKIISIVYHKNSNRLKYPSLTFNKGISLLKNEKFISLLDDDDKWEKNRLKIIDIELKNGSEWVSHYYKVDSKIVKYSNFVFKHKKIKNKKDIFPNSSEFFGAPSFHSFNKELFNKFGKWDENFLRGPCQEWFTRLYINGIKPKIINQTLGIYLLNPISITFNDSENTFYREINSRINFIKKYFDYYSLSKIIMTGYSSASLDYSRLTTKLNHPYLRDINNYNFKVKIKVIIYFFFLNLFIIFKKIK